LFIAAVATIPRPARPWGAITWLAAVYGAMRPTIYALGQRATAGWAVSSGGRPEGEEVEWVLPPVRPARPGSP
jgi:hypothetical protein